MSPDNAAHDLHSLASESTTGSTRRRFIAGVGVMALTSSPLAARAEIETDTGTGTGTDTSDAVSFADGPRPLVR